MVRKKKKKGSKVVLISIETERKDSPERPEFDPKTGNSIFKKAKDVSTP